MFMSPSCVCVCMFFDEIVGEMNRMEDEEWNQRMYEEQMRWEWEHDYDNERH